MITEHVREAIEAATGLSLGDVSTRPVSGGCINETFVLASSGSSEKFFVKANCIEKTDMFEAEAAALTEIAETEAIRVPLPVCRGAGGGKAFLVLEYIELQERGDEEEMGRRLAALHRVEAVNRCFGWSRNNTIGETPQINTWNESWSDFFARERIGRQLLLAEERGRFFRNGGRLLEKISELLQDHDPSPSLLHGDLWGGNAGYDVEGMPVVFDPAAYYGDRETDIAFTKMFGGFGPDFYAAYGDSFPLSDGFGLRKQLYNLYHVLNHFNLFGGGYGDDAERMIDALASM